MKEYENVEFMFSRFQTFVSRLKVLNKRENTYDHIKKIVKNLTNR